MNLAIPLEPPFDPLSPGSAGSCPANRDHSGLSKREGTLNTPQCNVCGSEAFVDFRKRPAAQCGECGSLERTRVLMLHLQKLNLLSAGTKVLHFAPERGLATTIRRSVGEENYTPVDINPKRYLRDVEGVKRFDLCKDSFSLKPQSFDVILHSHVMEHVPCNYGAVLVNLHRALTTRGFHICSIPILPGRYDETTARLDAQEAVRRFGQHDHVRRFGADDLSLSLGMIFWMPESYDLSACFHEAELTKAHVPKYAQRGFSPHSVFVFPKDGLRLRV